MRVVFVIRSLQYGGTERQVVAMARGLVERGHDVSILQLHGRDDFDDELGALPVERLSIGVRSRFDLDALASRRVRAFLAGADVLHGFHAESNLICLLAGLLARRPRVVWGVRVGSPDGLATDAFARATARAQRRLARHVDLVIANSIAGGRWTLAAGVPETRLRVIHNGVDTELFRPDATARSQLRAAWSFAADDLVIGCVARLHPIKQPELFVAAAAEFARRHGDARFVWIGRGEPGYLERLEHQARGHGIADSLVWAGPRGDVQAGFNAIDLSTLLGRNEGTPNAVLESLACEVPCVATATGDAARSIADDRLVVREWTPDAIAAAWERALELATPSWRAEARRRVARDYGVDAMVEATEAALLRLLAR